MEDKSKFWISVWRIAGAVLCVLISTIGGCNAYQSYLVRDAIKDGANPIEAVCAIAPSSASPSDVCSIKAAQGTKQ